MLQVTPVKAFSDNYIWLAHCPQDPARVAVVDPGESKPVLSALAEHGLRLAAVMVTHHHPDHVGGIHGLLTQFRVPVYGPASEKIPARSVALAHQDRVQVPGTALAFEVLEVPGHTAGHIAYYGHGAVFCGDTLFVGGCGRLFEGSPAQMTHSLGLLAALPGDTAVYCAHEYTLSNLRFARAADAQNAELARFEDEARELRRQGRPTVPSTIAREKQINPFLRCRETAIKRSAEARVGHPLNDETEVFATVRAWKDAF